MPRFIQRVINSNLDRENIYRVNIGVRKSTFIGMFGAVPARPVKGGVVDMAYDFTETDKILPHPSANSGGLK